MSPNVPPLLRLPLELRDQIYDYALLETDELCLKKPPRSASFWSTTRRHRARLLQDAHSDKSTFATDAPIGRVNKQMRRELSDVLRRSPLPVVARIRSFDFGHVIDYLKASGLQQHTAGADGMTSRRLVIEMVGPYGAHWKSNLIRWIQTLEELLSENGELGALHKSLRHSTSAGTLHAPPEVLLGVSRRLKRWPVGSGRKELDKIFLTLYARWRAEEAIFCPVPVELREFLGG